MIVWQRGKARLQSACMSCLPFCTLLIEAGPVLVFATPTPIQSSVNAMYTPYSVWACHLECSEEQLLH